ncbi:hypothetical protein LY76DRAFT_31575 [Colletotrichum caudatum]|nr:hypothetical protein LY76DRAFT_31575 [Colletotrichum caudatum]
MHRVPDPQYSCANQLCWRGLVAPPWLLTCSNPPHVTCQLYLVGFVRLGSGRSACLRLSYHTVWTGHMKLYWHRCAISQRKKPALVWWLHILGGLSTIGLAVSEHRISVKTDESSVVCPQQAAPLPASQAHMTVIFSSCCLTYN